MLQADRLVVLTHLVLPMFRSFIIAVTLTGMALCQYRCMATETVRAGDGQTVRNANACRCCHPSPSSSEQPGQPCCPGHDGDCHCQGVCGGAVTGDPFSLDQLMLAWMAAVTWPATAHVVDLLPAARSQFTDGEPSAPGAPDGRALRILIASLLT